MSRPHRSDLATDARGVTSLLGVVGRSERPVLVTVGALVLVIAALFTAGPRLLERAEAASLAEAIDEAPAVQRRLAIRALDNFPPGSADDPLDVQRQVVEEASSVVPDVVDGVFGESSLATDSNRFVVRTINGTEPASTTSVAFRIHPDLTDHSEIVDGRAAARTNDEVDERRVLEFDVSQATAEVMGLAVGDLLDLEADISDPITRRYDGGLPAPFVGRVVGIRQLTDAGDAYWFGDSRLHRPVVVDTGVGADFTFVGAIGVDVLPVRPFLVDQGSPFTAELRRTLRDGSITVDNVDEVLSGLDALRASSVTLPSPGRPGVVVGLNRVLEEEIEQRQTARRTLQLAAVGVLSVVLVLLVQVLQVAFSRRRTWLTVARSRGASRRQVVTAGVAEVMFVGIVSVGVGHVLARVVVGGSTSPTETRLLGALLLGGAGVALLIAVAETRRPVGAAVRSDGPQPVGTGGRIVRALVVALAVAAFVTFRRRGLGGDDGDSALLTLLVPVLIPMAVVVLTQRLVPRGLRVVSSAGLRLGPGRLLGVRRAMAEADAGAGLIAVLALACTVGALGLGIGRSLDDGIVDASWADVGAPYRADTRDPELLDAISSTPGVQAVRLGDSTFRAERGGENFVIRLLSVDVPGLDQLVAGTAAEFATPSGFVGSNAEGQIPTIAASRVGGAPVRIGDVLRGTGPLDAVEFAVVEVRDTEFGRDRDWLLVDRSTFEEATGQPAPTSILRFDASGEGLAAVLALASDAGVDVEDRAALAARQATDPLVRAVRLGYLVAGAVAAGFALLGVVALAVVTERQRRRQLALLDVLGVRRREFVRAIRWELLTPAFAGVVLGFTIGWLVTWAFDGRIDLSSFSGGIAVPIEPDTVLMLAGGAVLVVLATALVAVLSIRISATDTNDVLRTEGAA